MFIKCRFCATEVEEGKAVWIEARGCTRRECVARIVTVLCSKCLPKIVEEWWVYFGDLRYYIVWGFS